MVMHEVDQVVRGVLDVEDVSDGVPVFVVVRAFRVTFFVNGEKAELVRELFFVLRLWGK